jgi:hypothetical protein
LKLPFDLGIKLIFRLLIPGFLLTLGLYPILATVKERNRWPISIEYLFIFSVVLTGWLVVTLDQPIYMFLEGRRFWPRPIRALFLWLERKRLERLLHTEGKSYHLAEVSEKGAKYQHYNRLNKEAWVELRYFPLNGKGQPEARFPTRLGNLIDSYESYPSTRYGIDTIFYWYRLALKLDKDLREEIDTRQALADSSIYGAIALFVSGLFWFFYGLTYSLGKPIVEHFSPRWVWLITGAFVLFSFLLYRAALYSQAQYGEFFKSIFDVFEKQIDVHRAVEQVAKITSRPELNNADRKTQLKTAWRYLHNYKVKCPMPECAFLDPMSPEEFEAHQPRHATPPGPPINKAYVFAPYRSALGSADRLDKSLVLVKALSAILGLLVLAFACYWNMRLVIAALGIAGVGLVIEIVIRKRQRPYLVTMAGIERRLMLPPLYLKVERNYLKDLYVLFPHVAIIGLAIIATILWFTEYYLYD